MKKIRDFIIGFSSSLATWLLLTATFEMEMLVAGIIVSFLIATLFCKNCGVVLPTRFSIKVLISIVAFALVFVRELIVSNLDVASRVLSPSLPINPGIVEIKTTLKNSYARLLLANAITLTPGTLTVDLKEDAMFIHWIDVTKEDIEGATQEIAAKFEKHLEVIYG